MHPAFYISCLWPRLGLALPLPPVSLPIENAAAGEYKVEDILDSHMGDFKPEYLMK